MPLGSTTVPTDDGSAPEPEPDPLAAEQDPPAQPLPCGCLTVLLCACVLEWVVEYVAEAEGTTSRAAARAACAPT